MDNDHADMKPPKGTRFLIQLPDAVTERDMRARLLRMFGPKKGSAAIIVAGTVRPRIAQGYGNPSVPWVPFAEGFRAFLPFNWNAE